LFEFAPAVKKKKKRNSSSSKNERTYSKMFSINNGAAFNKMFSDFSHGLLLNLVVQTKEGRRPLILSFLCEELASSLDLGRAAVVKSYFDENAKFSSSYVFIH
jgi:hypothetical protein